jgi:hypothetical protein
MRRLVPGCELAAPCALPAVAGAQDDYTDTPPEGAPPLSGSDEVVLEPTP